MQASGMKNRFALRNKLATVGNFEANYANLRNGAYQKLSKFRLN